MAANVVYCVYDRSVAFLHSVLPDFMILKPDEKCIFVMAIFLL